MVTFVRAASLSGYAAVARRCGLEPRETIRAAGLNSSFLANPDLRIPVAAVAALLEDSARKSGCDTFGLQMAESWRMSDFGAISLLLTHERTLRDAITATIRYRHLLNDSLTLSIEDAGAFVIVREELATGGAVPMRQAIELAMGVVFRMFRALLGPQWKPVGVRFRHEPPADLSVHRRLFGTQLQFNQEFNGIVCAAADLDRPNASADPAMASYARGFMDSLSRGGGIAIAREVRSAIQVLLPSGRATIEQIAQGLGMTPRTLQRQLDDAGETFSALLNDVRREIVPRYLENPAYSLTQVAGLLGYGFPSSFTRWFVAQFGKSPARWRAAHTRTKHSTVTARKRVR
jgi:AraC-like DNA-binding protein